MTDTPERLTLNFGTHVSPVIEAARNLANANNCPVYIYMPTDTEKVPVWKTTNIGQIPKEATIVIAMEPNFVPKTALEQLETGKGKENG